MKQEKSMYFISVEQPAEVRTTLVEASTLILEAFRHYEQYKRVTQEKLREMGALRTLIQELKELNNLLFEQLPKVHLRVKADSGEEMDSSISSAEREQLKKLESEIKAIEEELHELA